MQLLELSDICTKLSDKVTTLENELKGTKSIYNKALITLTKKVKKLEKKLKHKRRWAVVDSSEDEKASLDKEDSPKHKQGEAHETAGHRTESDDTKAVGFSTASPQKDADEITLAETLVTIKKSAAKNKGGYTLKKLKQYTFEEIKMLFDRTMESIRKFVPIESEGQIAYSKAGEGSSKEGESLKDPLNKKWDKNNKRNKSSSNPNEDKEIALWVELKKLFKLNENDELWKFESFELIKRLYDWCGVQNISTRDGQDIFMIVEKEYPLSRGALLMMLVQKLQVDEHNEMAKELLRKIFMQAERPI
nr:hypothetical protein [Tanacetum cinerariifolium]